MKADERRQMLLDRAKKLFSQRGYYETQISDIIKNAKIARGTLYQYFKDRRGTTRNRLMLSLRKYSMLSHPVTIQCQKNNSGS